MLDKLNIKQVGILSSFWMLKDNEYYLSVETIVVITIMLAHVYGVIFQSMHFMSLCHCKYE